MSFCVQGWKDIPLIGVRRPELMISSRLELSCEEAPLKRQVPFD